MAPPTFLARRDPKLRARILSDRRLVYDATSPSPSGGAPPHVRAGSGIAWTGDRMVVIQDDADQLAVIEGGGASVTALPLRGVSGARHGKSGSGHLSLEAVMSARDWRGEFLLAFGSGLSVEQRVVARVRLGGGDTELSTFEARSLYGALDEIDGFATSLLNVEGVALLPRGVEGRDGVRLFHRGNLAARPGVSVERHLSATVDVRLDALLAYLDRTRRDPAAFLGFDLHEPRRYDLDEYEDARFSFTDAAVVPAPPGSAGGPRVAFVAIAERAASEAAPAECIATALGVIEPDGSARYTIVVERDGQITRRRAEGMVLTSPTAGCLVIQDRAEGPATLATFELSGL